MGIFQAMGVWFVLAMTIALLLLGALLRLGWRFFNRTTCPSPFASGDLVPATELTYDAVKAIDKLLLRLDSPENPSFPIEHAAVCQASGKILPNCITSYGAIKGGRNPLARHWKGQWIPLHNYPAKKQEAILALRALGRNRLDDVFVEKRTENLIVFEAVPETGLALPLFYYTSY